MTLHRRGFALAVVVLAAAVLGSPAWAGVPTEQLKSQIDRVLKVLDDPDLKKENRAHDRRASVRRIANDIFDFSETAKRSLARHWQSRTPAEREEFVQLFGDLLERSYISKIELYGGEKIGYIGESMDGDLATVRTRIVTRHGSEIPIDYKMHHLGSRWLVYDVTIEGVSLVANYRTQFNKIIQTSSYAELVKRMKTKQEEFLEDERQRRTSQK
ncbi:MAG: ABC transporter substrate-binding protein [Candidatus Rokubacteria bacterium]|nr:ABC transporter substrate-binding protein [Candidatus Rokubacteria bacterium]MBI2015194.1 ABC transporter substrate-binding protein [Candidatus Rokubacteria bacterium]MBI2156704.1 ABC transporter substrate-binding protein [Candidatus Rokubacteria bacterium]MBI2491615.1 ABC transporter substrate-binding protein [Candidatus Rokubacteria bacterium]MBI4628408.1 ABC transporter substrate-binding protein [Candidatus Rokubacteria bacterium]